MTPTITPEQRHPLDDQGFFVLENVFTRQEMDALARRIEEHQRRHQKALADSGGTQGISRRARPPNSRVLRAA